MTRFEPGNLLIQAFALMYLTEGVWLLTTLNVIPNTARRVVRFVLILALIFALMVIGYLIFSVLSGNIAAIRTPIMLAILLALAPLPSLFVNQNPFAALALGFMLVMLAAISLFSLAPFGFDLAGWIPSLMQAYPITALCILGLSLYVILALWRKRSEGVRSLLIRFLALLLVISGTLITMLSMLAMTAYPG